MGHLFMYWCNGPASFVSVIVSGGLFGCTLFMSDQVPSVLENPPMTSSLDSLYFWMNSLRVCLFSSLIWVFDLG